MSHKISNLEKQFVAVQFRLNQIKELNFKNFIWEEAQYLPYQTLIMSLI